MYWTYRCASPYELEQETARRRAGGSWEGHPTRRGEEKHGDLLDAQPVDSLLSAVPRVAGGHPPRRADDPAAPADRSKPPPPGSKPGRRTAQEVKPLDSPRLQGVGSPDRADRTWRNNDG